MRRLLIVWALLTAVPVLAQPVTYAWRLECENDKTFGPFGTPDACTAQRNEIAASCEHPTRVEQGRTVANPNFMRIADICKESLNGRGCDCVYAAYPAQQPAAERPRGCTVLDLWRCLSPEGEKSGVCTLDDRLRCARWLAEPATP